jgi:hypothetical protein
VRERFFRASPAPPASAPRLDPHRASAAPAVDDTQRERGVGRTNNFCLCTDYARDDINGGDECLRIGSFALRIRADLAALWLV